MIKYIKKIKTYAIDALVWKLDFTFVKKDVPYSNSVWIGVNDFDKC